MTHTPADNTQSIT